MLISSITNLKHLHIVSNHHILGVTWYYCLTQVEYCQSGDANNGHMWMPSYMHWCGIFVKTTEDVWLIKLFMSCLPLFRAIFPPWDVSFLLLRPLRTPVQCVAPPPAWSTGAQAVVSGWMTTLWRGWCLRRGDTEEDEDTGTGATGPLSAHWPDTPTQTQVSHKVLRGS